MENKKEEIDDHNPNLAIKKEINLSKFPSNSFSVEKSLIENENEDLEYKVKISKLESGNKKQMKRKNEWINYLWFIIFNYDLL